MTRNELLPGNGPIWPEENYRKDPLKGVVQVAVNRKEGVMKPGKSKRGFTLMELVVTTAIMGTLAATAVPIFVTEQQEANTRTTISNMSNLGSALVKDYNNKLASGGINEAKFGVALNTVILLSADTSGLIGDPLEINTRLANGIAPPAPLSPFGSTFYRFELQEDGSVEYVQDPDTEVITSIIVSAKFTINDVEDPNLTLSFTS